MQIVGHQGFDYNLCLTAKEFGKQAIMATCYILNIIFWIRFRYPYDKQTMIDDFEALSTYLANWR